MLQVSLSPALNAAADLIRANGGIVHFPRPNVVVWGQEFTSLKAVSKDPRCEVSYLTLFKRIKLGVNTDEAVKKNVYSRACKQVSCWGENFESMRALALDNRCKVSYTSLTQKIASGMTPEEAASDSRLRKPITTIEQAIVS